MDHAVNLWSDLEIPMPALLVPFWQTSFAPTIPPFGAESCFSCFEKPNVLPLHSNVDSVFDNCCTVARQLSLLDVSCRTKSTFKSARQTPAWLKMVKMKKEKLHIQNSSFFVSFVLLFSCHFSIVCRKEKLMKCTLLFWQCTCLWILVLLSPNLKTVLLSHKIQKSLILTNQLCQLGQATNFHLFFTVTWSESTKPSNLHWKLHLLCLSSNAAKVNATDCLVMTFEDWKSL